MVKKILYTDINISRLDSFIDSYLNKNKKLPDGFPTFSSIEIRDTTKHYHNSLFR